jgi:hypothetical protein
VFCEILQIVISAALNVFTQFTRPIISAALGDRPHSTYVPVIERSRDVGFIQVAFWSSSGAEMTASSRLPFGHRAERR